MEDPTKYEREVLLEETKNIFLKAISRVQWYPYSDPIVSKSGPVDLPIGSDGFTNNLPHNFIGRKTKLILGGFPSGKYNGQSTLVRKQWAPPPREGGSRGGGAHCFRTKVDCPLCLYQMGKPPTSALFSYEIGLTRGNLRRSGT